jgi:hypothetical protein
MAVHEAPGRVLADVDAHCRAELASCDFLRLRGLIEDRQHSRTDIRHWSTCR